MRESFFAQGRAYAELRRIEQLCETGYFDAIPTTPTSNSYLSIAVANGILPGARHKQYELVQILELKCDKEPGLIKIKNIHNLAVKDFLLEV